MEGRHVDVESEKSNNVSSIFTLFSNITGEKNQNPKFCIELIKSLRGNEFAVGSGSNAIYSIKRIVRGLGSTRLHSQCGCFASLACILKSKACSVADVLEVLEKEQCPVKGATKSELKALNVECVLTCGAIISSGLFIGQPVEVQEIVLKKLVEAGSKKNYLTSVTCRFLVDVVQVSERIKFKKVIWPILISNLLASPHDCCEDRLYLLSVCLKKNYKTVSKFLRKSFSSCDSLEKTIVVFLLRNCVNYDHPIYESAAELLCANLDVNTDFWLDCVKENSKKGFQKNGTLIAIFFHILKNLSDASIVPKLLVPGFIEVLLKVLSFRRNKSYKNDDSFEMAKSSLNVMVSLLCSEQTSGEIRFETINKLLLFPANMKFEMITGTKCIHILTSSLDSDLVKKLASTYRQVVNGDLKKVIDENGAEENWSCKEKQIALNTFTKILNHPFLRNEINWKLDQIKFIFDVGFIREKSELSSELQKNAKECFYKAIMLQMPSLKDLVFFLDELALDLNESIQKKNLKLVDEVVLLWNKMFSVILNLRNKSKNKLFVAVHVLLIYMGFHLFQDTELAKGGIEELLSCYSRLKEIHKKKENNEEDTPHWTEVTVDLILSLLSRENKLWRHVVSCIFSQIAIHLTPSALHQIIEALDPKSESDVLSRADSERSESDSENPDESESGSSESEGSDPDDKDGEETANEQLRLAVRNALGYNAAALTDEESIDMDQMNEEEEKKLNERLGQAFKLFKNQSGKGKKKRQTKEEEAVTHFRIRVLDLVEMYISSRPSMGACLDLILPLLEVLEFAIKDPFRRPLQNKVDSILRSVSAAKCFSDSEGVNQTVLKAVFESVIAKKEIPSPIFVEMCPRISDCTTFLVRCSQQLPKTDDDGAVPLLDQYDSLLKSFFTSRDFKLPISVFQAVLRITWKGNFKLTKILFEFLAASNVRIFKKMKAIELLRLFYKNEKLHESADEKSNNALSDAETNFVDNFAVVVKDYDRADKNSLSFFSNIITLINVIRCCREKHRRQTKKCPPWKKLISRLAEISSIVDNKKTRSQLANLAAAFQVPLPPISAAAKRKRNGFEAATPKEDDEELRAPSEKKKKIEKVREKQKLKKESRKMREEMCSHGLESIRFSAVDASSWPGPDADAGADGDAGTDADSEAEDSLCRR